MTTHSFSEVKTPWIQGLKSAADGKLFFAGRHLDPELPVLSQEGPFYLYSTQIVKTRALGMQQVLEDALGRSVGMHFALKSNHHPEICKAIKEIGWGLDVVSGGELTHSFEQNFLPEQIVFSGVAKSERELEQALSSQVGQINVESLPELVRIFSIAKRIKKKASIAFRINPEVHPETHPYIATGFRENKFGIDRSDFLECLNLCDQNRDWFDFKGLSLHIGSQLVDFSAHREALEKTLEMKPLLQKFGLKMAQLDLGGGVGISYHQDENADFEILCRYADVLKSSLAGESCRIIFEPGRFVVARAGILVGQIEYVKKTQHKSFLICNVGMNALMRPALYEAYHRIEISSQFERSSFNESQVYDVVGPICESADVLGVLRNFKDPRQGDFVVVADVGAYGSVLANEYNLRPKVREIYWHS